MIDKKEQARIKSEGMDKELEINRELAMLPKPDEFAAMNQALLARMKREGQ